MRNEPNRTALVQPRGLFGYSQVVQYNLADGRAVQVRRLSGYGRPTYNLATADGPHYVQRRARGWYIMTPTAVVVSGPHAGLRAALATLAPQTETETR